MSFDLAVWHGETIVSVKDAADLYLKLCKQEWTSTEWYASVEAFYVELCSRYPEIDTLSDDELDRCPWSCAHDRSGHHIIMCLNDGDQLEEAALFVTRLAARHDLICFDPQGQKVYLPPGLKPKRSRFQLW
jgi:hypothetical protein